MKKSKKHVQFHSAKWFWPSIFAHDDEASTRHSKAQERASSAAWCSLWALSCNIETCTGQLVALYENLKDPTRPFLMDCFHENQRPTTTQVSYPSILINGIEEFWLQWLADGSSSGCNHYWPTQKLMNMEKSLLQIKSWNSHLFVRPHHLSTQFVFAIQAPNMALLCCNPYRV